MKPVKNFVSDRENCQNWNSLTYHNILLRFSFCRSSFFFSDLISFRKNMKNIFIWWVFLLSSQIENFLLSENVNYGISLCRRQQWIFPSSEARGEIVLWKSKSRQRKKLTFNWMWTAAKTGAPREIQTVHYIHRSVCTYCIYIGRRYDSWWENAHLFLAFSSLAVD